MLIEIAKSIMETPAVVNDRGEVIITVPNKREYDKVINYCKGISNKQPTGLKTADQLRIQTNKLKQRDKILISLRKLFLEVDSVQPKDLILEFSEQWSCPSLLTDNTCLARGGRCHVLSALSSISAR